MSRPKSKSELINLSRNNFTSLMEYIDALSDKERLMEFPKGTLNRNIRDVLAHLHHWHMLFLKWYREGMQGLKPVMPSEGYTWKDIPALNVAIQKQYSKTGLSDVRELLLKSFTEVQQIIEAHGDKELFTKKLYNWTGSTSLGSYLVSSTSSHYDWALKLFKRCKK